MKSLIRTGLGTFLFWISVMSHGEAQTLGDAKRGALLFLQCRACHSVRPDEKLPTGPNLFQIMGRKVASADFAYSPALAGLTLTWTPETLDQWLKRPSTMVPGTKMNYAGLASDKDRADIIAYLGTLR